MARESLRIDNARYVLTLDRERRIIRDGSILVEDGRIRRVGKAADLAGARADRVIDARRLLVTPGFMNGHMHISYAHPVRGIFPDEMASPLNHVFNLQAAMTEEEEYHASLLGIVELLKSGTVCFVDPGSTKFPDACLQAYEDSGIRVIMGECVTDVQAPWNLPKYATGDAVRRTAAFIDKWNGRLDGRLTAWAMPFSPETCTAELLSELKKVVDERRTMLTLHHNSGAQQRQDYQARHGRRPTEYLESLGVLGPNVLLAHVLGIDDAEIDCIARTRTAVVMCPITAAKGGRGVPEHGRMPELLRQGREDRPRGGLAEQLQSPGHGARDEHGGDPVQGRPPGHAPDSRRDRARDGDALAAPRRSAWAISSAPSRSGKKADLVLFDTERPEWQAMWNPVSNLVYNADGRSVHTVIVDGRVVVDAYRQSFVDEPKLFAEVQEIGERLQARTGITFPRSRWPIV